MSFFSSLFGGSALNSDKFEILEKQDFKASIQQGKVQLVDVRTPREYKGGHIAKAINIDLFQVSNFKQAFEKLDKSKPVYLYCRSGSRSKRAAQKLLDMGFEMVYDLKGGYLVWS